MQKKMDHRPPRTFVENTFKLKVPEINGHRSSWLKTKCCILHKREVQLSGPDLQIGRQKTVSPHKGQVRYDTIFLERDLDIPAIL